MTDLKQEFLAYVVEKLNQLEERHEKIVERYSTIERLFDANEKEIKAKIFHDLFYDLWNASRSLSSSSSPHQT